MDAVCVFSCMPVEVVGKGSQIITVTLLYQLLLCLKNVDNMPFLLYLKVELG